MATSNDMNEEVKQAVLLNKTFPVFMSILCSEKYPRRCLTKLNSKCGQLWMPNDVTSVNFNQLAQAVQKVDDVIHRINRWPVDKS